MYTPYLGIVSFSCRCGRQTKLVQPCGFEPRALQSSVYFLPLFFLSSFLPFFLASYSVLFILFVRLEEVALMHLIELVFATADERIVQWYLGSTYSTE